MHKKYQTAINKLSSILEGKGIFTKIDPNYLSNTCRGTICLYIESKTFTMRNDKNLKLYIYGTLTYSSDSKLEKYGTKMVLAKKNTSDETEQVIHSLHFDGDVNEVKTDHPIFHMQFDNTLIHDISSKDSNYFQISPWPESRLIRIPTPQMDVLTCLYYYLQTMDQTNQYKLPRTYLEDIKKTFGIISVTHGFTEEISKVMFP
ncbi:MAG: hypothetical protein WA099_04430 [Sulfuricurvum sp.]